MNKHKHNSGGKYKIGAFINKSPLTGSNNYLSLINSDLLYHGNFKILKNPEFQYFLHKMLKDYILLLHMKYDDFWKEIKESQSLRFSLESCLEIFPRKISKPHVKKGSSPEVLSTIFKDPIYKKWCVLMQMVILIYHRIIMEIKEQQKYLIYDLWLFDIPKILNFLDIYSYLYPKLAKQILHKLFHILPEYHQDVIDFIHNMKEIFHTDLERQLSYQFTQQIIKTSNNFRNPRLTFSINLIKSLYFVYQTYNAILMFLQFFPYQSVLSLVSEKNLHLMFFDYYFIFMENIRGRWEIFQELKNSISPTIEQIRQTIIKVIIKALDYLFLIVFKKKVQSQTIWIRCIKIYAQIAMDFAKRQETNCTELWDELFSILMKQIFERPIFPISQQIFEYLQRQEIQTIKACHEHEKQQRKKIKVFDEIETINIKLQKIPSLKQWRRTPQIDSLNFEQQSEFNTSFLDDTFLQMLRSNKQQKNQMVKKQIFNLQQLSFNLEEEEDNLQEQMRLKEKRLIDEYNDEYQQTDNEECLIFGLIFDGFLDSYQQQQLSRQIKLTKQEQNLSFSVQSKKNTKKYTNLHQLSLIKEDQDKILDQLLISSINQANSSLHKSSNNSILNCINDQYYLQTDEEQKTLKNKSNASLSNLSYQNDGQQQYQGQQLSFSVDRKDSSQINLSFTQIGSNFLSGKKKRFKNDEQQGKKMNKFKNKKQSKNEHLKFKKKQKQQHFNSQLINTSINLSFDVSQKKTTKAKPMIKQNKKLTKVVQNKKQQKKLKSQHQNTSNKQQISKSSESEDESLAMLSSLAGVVQQGKNKRK